MSGVPILTIDGPSGSGKGTVSRAAARALGWALLDSGALYRLVALAGSRAAVSLDDGAGLARLAQTFDIRFGSGPAGEEVVSLNGREVTREIRTETAGNDASKVAALPAVRAALLERQRRFAVPPGLVADGRDMGTVVFPAARVKIFLTASADERAARRHKPVSYTHLDVYKRQMRALGVRIEQASPTQVSIHGVGLHGLTAPAHALDMGCLLYTSRCV